jgi:predicted phosphodiesterase
MAMKLLVFSDIHDNISRVRQIRKLERNIFDAIVIAGDIGSKHLEEFTKILDSFSCPVMMVFGNWDYASDYKTQLSVNCKLLHLNVIKIKDYYFAGFSGCETSWGKNPIYLEEKEKVNIAHSQVLLKLLNARKKVEKNKEKIELRFKEKSDLMRFNSKDQRKIRFKKRIEELNEEKELALEKTGKAISRVIHSKKYKLYSMEIGECSKIALRRNRDILFKKIIKSKLPVEKLVVITHERLYRFVEEGITPLLHIYGHVHQYKFNFFRGTHYLNAAAVDNGMSAFFGSKNLRPEGYCVVELVDKNVLVNRINFEEEKTN